MLLQIIWKLTQSYYKSSENLLKVITNQLKAKLKVITNQLKILQISWKLAQSYYKSTENI